MSPDEYFRLYANQPLTEEQAGNAWATGVAKEKWEVFMSQVYATVQERDRLLRERSMFNRGDFTATGEPPSMGQILGVRK